MTIDELVDELTQMKKTLGGNTKVVIENYVTGEYHPKTVNHVVVEINSKSEKVVELG